MKILGAVSLFLFGASIASGQQSASVTSDGTTYSTEGSDLVVWTLKNTGSSDITAAGDWAVWKGTQLFYHPMFPQVVSSLAPGESKTWTWNKKNTYGLQAAQGQYTIKYGPIVLNGSLHTLSATVELSDAKAILKTDRASYTTTGPDTVVVSLFNPGYTNFTAAAFPSIRYGGKVVWQDPFNSSMFPVGEGETKSFTWSKKTFAPSLAVVPGTYEAQWKVILGYTTSVTVVTTLSTHFTLVDPVKSLSVTTDRAVYTRTGSDDVVVTLKNTGSTPLTVAAKPTIWDGTKLVTSAASASSVKELLSGGSTTWTWTKRSLTGGTLPAGSYTVKWEGSYGGSSLTASHRFALASYGKIAGSSRFPLDAGNQWVYKTTAGEKHTLTVEYQLWGLLWYKVSGLFDDARSASMTGTTYPILYVTQNNASTSNPLFRFGRSVGYVYSVEFDEFPAGSKLVVGATNDTVRTPMGKFTGCYRLDVTGVAGHPYHSFHFAAGVGLVQYKKYSQGNVVAFQLTYATIRGTDGKTYTLGNP